MKKKKPGAQTTNDEVVYVNVAESDNGKGKKHFAYCFNDELRSALIEAGMKFNSETYRYELAKDTTLKELRKELKEKNIQVITREDVEINKKPSEKLASEELMAIYEKYLAKSEGVSIKEKFKSFKALYLIHEKVKEEDGQLLVWYKTIGMDERKAQRAINVGRVFFDLEADHVVGYSESALFKLAALGKLGKAFIEKQIRYSCRKLEYLKREIPEEDYKKKTKDLVELAEECIEKYNVPCQENDEDEDEVLRIDINKIKSKSQKQKNRTEENIDDNDSNEQDEEDAEEEYDEDDVKDVAILNIVGKVEKSIGELNNELNISLDDALEEALNDIFQKCDKWIKDIKSIKKMIEESRKDK